MKNKYLKRLRKSLKKQGVTDTDDIIKDYEEYFYEKSKEGKTDQQIIEMLGDVNELTQSYLENLTAEEKALKTKHRRNVGLFIAMQFINFIFLIGIVVGIISIVVSLFLSFVATGLALIIQGVFNLDVSILVGLLLIVTGVAVFVGLGFLTFNLCKATFTALINYVKWNISLLSYNRPKYLKSKYFMLKTSLIVSVVAIILIAVTGKAVYELTDTEIIVEEMTYQNIEYLDLDLNNTNVIIEEYEGNDVIVTTESKSDRELIVINQADTVLSISPSTEQEFEFSQVLDIRNSFNFHQDKVTIQVPNDVVISELAVDNSNLEINDTEISDTSIDLNNYRLELSNVSFSADLTTIVSNNGFTTANKVNFNDLSIESDNGVIKLSDIVFNNFVADINNQTLTLNNSQGENIDIKANNAVLKAEDLVANDFVFEANNSTNTIEDTSVRNLYINLENSSLKLYNQVIANDAEITANNTNIKINEIEVDVITIKLDNSSLNTNGDKTKNPDKYKIESDNSSVR